MEPYAGVIEKYRPLINAPTGMQAVTLLEGNTPLIPMPNIADQLGGDFALWIKFEGLNPTGSFKDRGMTVAVSEAAIVVQKLSSALPQVTQPPPRPPTRRVQG